MFSCKFSKYIFVASIINILSILLLFLYIYEIVFLFYVFYKFLVIFLKSDFLHYFMFRFLRGTCKDENCIFSHKFDPNKVNKDF